MSGFMLDTGALIAVERGDRRMLALLEAARAGGVALSVTAPVIAQAWHDGRRQARLAAFLKLRDLEVVGFTPTDARAVGELATLSDHADVVDVHLVLVAQQRRETIVTSDPRDVCKVDPRVRIVRI